MGLISQIQTDPLKIVVFSKSNADRDLLRRCLEIEKSATVFYFEKDQLKSILVKKQK